MSEPRQVYRPVLVHRGERPSAGAENDLRRTVGLLVGAAPPSSAAGTAVPFQVRRFQIVSVEGDYLTCYAYAEDGETLATEAVNVAKPPTLRNSVTARGAVTYTYTATDARTADDGSNTAEYVVAPSYSAGDDVYALGPVLGGSGVTNSEISVIWLDQNVDGRQWAEVPA